MEPEIRNYYKPLVASAASNNLLAGALSKGWFARTCFSQGYQAELIVSAFKQVGWKSPFLVRHGWGSSFESAITLLGLRPVGKVVLAGTSAVNTGNPGLALCEHCEW